MSKSPALLEKTLKSRASAWIAVVDPQTDRVLLGKRAKSTNNGGQWNLFGGGVDAGESALEAAVRELREEAGLVVSASAVRQIGTTPTNATVFLLELTPDDVQARMKINKLEVEKVKWFPLDALPGNLHKSVLSLLHVLDNDTFAAPPTAPTMRHMLDVVENAKPKRGLKPVDRTALFTRVCDLMASLRGAPFFVAMNKRVTDQILRELQAKKEEFDRIQARDAELDPNYQPSAFPIENLPEIADDVVFHCGFGTFKSEVDDDMAAYQQRMRKDDENLYDYVEDSDYLRFLGLQKRLADALSLFRPSKLATYLPVLDLLSALKLTHGSRSLSQHEELHLVDGAAEDLAAALPVMVLVLTP